MSKDRLKWFGHVEKKNNDDRVKKIDKIRLKGNQEGVGQMG